uniref:Phage protein n=1 Tax=Syphacia muris TaxID=451379 RepID=A0A0N5AF29_9BILA
MKRKQLPQMPIDIELLLLPVLVPVLVLKDWLDWVNANLKLEKLQKPEQKLKYLDRTQRKDDDDQKKKKKEEEEQNV